MCGDIGVIMEAAILSSLRSRYLSQNLPNNAVQFGSFNFDVPCSAKHHTFPRASVSKRVKISDCDDSSKYASQNVSNVGVLVGDKTEKPEDAKLLGCFSREVSDAWQRHVGAPEDPAPADRVQSLFNDIELYPTKTQVFEMLVCARQCARRKSLTLTFGEFCVFAAELRKCSNQIRPVPKVESPQWNVDKDTVCKPKNGSELTPPPCEVFLGGSCNPTTWRSDIAIPILKKMGITYFNPQVDVWSSELIEVEYKAKAAARALLFVLDSETRTVATCVEAAHLATEPRDLLLVLRPYTRHQKIGRETISDLEYMELSRARATLQEVVERRGLPAFSDIPSALRCARAVLRGARTHPRHPLGQSIVRLKRAFDASGGRSGVLPRAQALQALQQVSQAPLTQLMRSLPKEQDDVDFETFCAVVAEVAANSESPCQNGNAIGSSVDRTLVNRDNERVEEASAKDTKVHQYYNPRLRSYGKKLKLDIPKNGGVQSEDTSSGSIGSSDSVFTPGTERRLERLPAMLGVPSHDVYLGGIFPSKNPRPEEYLVREGITYIIPRVNDYTRMFSAATRRSASSKPESPHADKRLRPDDEVELRVKKSEGEPSDRLSASDFYSVSEDVTPQPFKGTYDEDLLFGSKVLLFSVSAESPCFATMVLAAHYMGLRPNATVLMVQSMDPDNSHPYSETAVKDYNRGRHYLKDLARRGNVPVYDNMDDAMRAVVTRFKNPKTS